MSWYRVVAVNEETRPLAGITIEAFDLSVREVVASVVTNRAGEALFTGLTGPQFFRPRNRRISGTMGDKTFTGRIMIQVVGMDALCYDFVVDPDAGGTNTTLSSAVPAAITAAGTSGTQTIWLCGSVSEATIDIGGLGSSATIIIVSPDRSAVVITAAANSDVFEQTTAGGNVAGGLEFHNVGVAMGAGFSVLSVETGDELRNLVFDRCAFNGGNLISQTSTNSMGAISLFVQDCGGNLEEFYDGASAGGNHSPDSLNAYNNLLTLNNWWDGGSPDFTRVQGGRYVLGSTAGITFETGVDRQHWQDLLITFAAGNALFTTAALSNTVDDMTFQNIVIRITNSSGTFGNFGSAATNNNDGLFIKNIYGYGGGTGTFLTVDTDYLNAHVGNIYAKGFTTTYSGPAAGDDHGLLTGLSDDDHMQYALLAGRSTGQTLIGGTASGEDLTLQSTSNATRGSIFLGSSSQFELAESTGRLVLPTQGSGAGILMGTDVHLFESATGAPFRIAMPAGTTVLTLNATPTLTIGVDDTTRGFVDIYGAGAGVGPGGRFRTFMSANHDSVDNFWIAGVNEDDFLIDLENASSIFVLKHEGQLQLATTGSAAGILLGGDAQWYRSAANVLRTPDSVVVDGTLEVGTVQTYTESNVTTDRTYDADNVLIPELADVVGTLIADLRSVGIIN